MLDNILKKKKLSRQAFVNLYKQKGCYKCNFKTIIQHGHLIHEFGPHWHLVHICCINCGVGAL